MAIAPICDICKQELQGFGALLFSPPDNSSRAKKFHICQACYQDLVQQYSLNSDVSDD